MKTYPYKKAFTTILILALAFFAGRGFADFVGITKEEENVVAGTQVLEHADNNIGDSQAVDVSAHAVIENIPELQSWPFVLNSPLEPGTENWGMGYGEKGAKPTGNNTPEELKKYNAYFVAPGEEKVLYLTFDCGYENGNTAAILDALKKHNAPATFFVVGHFIKTAPELVKRMVEEGHMVGNHTYHHPDMSKITSLEKFQKEMDDVRTAFQELTGQEMPMYYRPPQGKYNLENLQMAKDLGYSTFFWSMAYVDWNVDNQPTHEEAFSKMLGRLHPGAIVLLHNTSRTNGEILDELLAKWEELGYTFRPLSELVESNTADT